MRNFKNQYLQYCSGLVSLWFRRKKWFLQTVDVPQTAELSWYLSCFSLQRLTLAHSFKDKADRLKMSMLFVFISHVDGRYLIIRCGVCSQERPIATSEITRDVASSFNHQMEKLCNPEAKIQEDSMLILGQTGENE
jgi:tryptophanyl-tRNA synthetase